MAKSDDIVITGVGVVSPVGIGREPYFDALLTGKSGVQMIEEFVDTPLEVKIGAPVTDFEPKKYVKPRKSLKVMCREVQMGFSAATLALDDAKLTAGDFEPERLGVVYGTEMLYSDISEMKALYSACQRDGEFVYDLYGESYPNSMYPLWMLMFLPNMTACHIGISIDGRGPNNTIVDGDASSLMAVAECVRVLQRGHADVMVAGGVGNRLNVTPLVYRCEMWQSRRNSEPERASRPFDADRDGIVNGEGGAAFVLETRSHAESRGATPLAVISGYGLSFEDRQDNRLPTGEGVARSISMALADSGVDASVIDHVNAHGSSAVDEDRAEAQAIRQTLGDTPVTAPKSNFGYAGAGCGAVEMAASVLALAEGNVPPTLNYETPDPDCPVNVIVGEPKPVDRDGAIVLSQSQGGQTAAVVLTRPS